MSLSVTKLTCWHVRSTITKTYLYNDDPLKPHFFIVKLGFTGVYIILLISAQKHRLWVLVRTASPRRFERVPTICGLSRKMKKISEILFDNLPFLVVKFSVYLNRRVFVMKTRNSLRIHTVWSESSLVTWRNIASLAIQNVASEASDQNAQADLNLRQAQMCEGTFSDVAGQTDNFIKVYFISAYTVIFVSLVCLRISPAGLMLSFMWSAILNN